MCGNRLNGFTLSVGNSSRNYTVCYQDTTTGYYGPGNVINGSCNASSPILGDTVKIMINNSQTLTLCEVQIFVCTPGTYGPDCGKRCGNCAEGASVCDTTSGLCPQRTPKCMPGYRPEKCDEVCTLGNYGPDCAMKCGHCADDQLSCDSVSGTCAETKPRCMSGYSDPKCDTACKGNYGPDCLQRCGNCAEGRSVCDAKSGNCPEGTPKCMPGYTGVNCDTECTLGTYGPGCKETCGFCAEGNAVCNTTSGHCPDREPRCAEGYYELWCKSELPVNPPNYTGVIAGSAVGIIVVLVIGVIVIVILMRRFQRNLQTGGATQSEPSSAAAQERSAPSEVEEGNEIPEPERMYDAWDLNSVEEHPYEAIRQNSRRV
ncbi:multiple epidermal growth factor-like domains protein 6 [Liolophura sinensis]|uniref:multiple epidermal growth factor-like domains protein 6 n=1 Tax=Liolophura sinensis TaxID=3198878 RepID=UPI0031589824